MRLPADKIKEAILHVDQDVRQAAVHYFSDGYSTDPDVMPIAIQAIERYSPSEAFEYYSFLARLAPSATALDWLIGQIEKAQPPANSKAEDFLGSCLAALAEAPFELLQSRYERIRTLQFLDDETRRLHELTLEFAARTPEELWQELDGLCREHDANFDDGDYEVPDDALDRMEQLADAIGRQGASLAERVLAILADADAGYWRLGHAIHVAGGLRLQAAVVPLIQRLQESDDDDWYFQECEQALAKIGADETIDPLRSLYLQAPYSFRMASTYVLQRVHADRSVQAALDLFGQEDDVGLKCQLLEAALLNMSADAIEPARQFILTTPPDPDVREVRSNLLTVCKLLATSFPEFAAWDEDAKNDLEFRRQWYQKHRPAISTWADEDESEFDDECDSDDYQPPLSHPDTYVHLEARVGRNDPCPCGSGEKFKKCCMKKRSGV